ncbi:MAG TPA: DUF2505 domain-containing protein [Pseudonocardiaceae bacterium]|jgi:hypothetical protein|nr:DUF2505 domain-containing protein [Pseudonocardiaceae bacterium]
MASQLALRHQYPASCEQMWDVLTDQQYLQAKLQAVGGPRAELVSWQRDEHAATMVLNQTVPGGAIPSFLRAMLPGELTIRRTETWRGCRGNVEAAVDGAPGTIAGVMSLEPDGTGCVLGSQITVDVPLPLIGGKVEKLVSDNIASLLETEYQFTLAWLRNPSSPRQGDIPGSGC